MGIGTILEAREVLLLGFGGRKAEALAAAIEGPVSPMVPASALHFHPLRWIAGCTMRGTRR